MALGKVLAREFKMQINTGTEAVPTWSDIKGLSSLTPSFGKNDASTKDFDTDGWDSHIVSGRSLSFDLSGQRVEDPADGSRDPGQEAVEAYAQEVGYDSTQKQFQLVRRSDDTALLRFRASAQVTPLGGGVDDASTWSATVTADGAPELNPV